MEASDKKRSEKKFRHLQNVLAAFFKLEKTLILVDKVSGRFWHGVRRRRRRINSSHRRHCRFDGMYETALKKGDFKMQP